MCFAQFVSQQIKSTGGCSSFLNYHSSPPAMFNLCKAAVQEKEIEQIWIWLQWNNEEKFLKNTKI